MKYLSLTGLQYLVEKLKNAFAPKVVFRRLALWAAIQEAFLHNLMIA